MNETVLRIYAEVCICVCISGVYLVYVYVLYRMCFAAYVHSSVIVSYNK